MAICRQSSGAAPETTVRPLPDSAVTEPRCALTIELTMARPKPWPDPLTDLLARTNWSKR